MQKRRIILNWWCVLNDVVDGIAGVDGIDGWFGIDSWVRIDG